MSPWHKKLLYILLGTSVGIFLMLLQQSTFILMRNAEFIRFTYKDSNYPMADHRLPSYTFKKRLPDALVIGVMKCGTDALRAFLAIHPDIAMSENEPNFWCEHFHRGYEYYLNQMTKSQQGQISMEKSTCFTHKRIYSARRVYYYDRDIKMIVMVREPIQRALSQFTLDKYNGEVGNISFEDAVLDKSADLLKASSPYIERSMYHTHTLRWLGYFKLEQFLFISMEDFRKDPINALEEIEDFLEISNNEWNQVLHFNKERQFYCTINGEEEKCLGRDKGIPHENIEPSTITKLENFFKEQNELFFTLIDKRFNWTYAS